MQEQKEEDKISTQKKWPYFIWTEQFWWPLTCFVLKHTHSEIPQNMFYAHAGLEQLYE